MSSNFEKHIADVINIGVSLGGVQVDQEEFLRRKEICSACPKQITMEMPLVGQKLQMPACGICKCFTDTKPRWKTYFSLKKLRIITSVCPHPDGNKWAN